VHQFCFLYRFKRLWRVFFLKIIEEGDMKIVPYWEVTAESIEDTEASGVKMRWVISQKDGAENFAMRVVEISPGGHSPLHQHPHEHEVFILKGKGILTCEGEKTPLVPGDVAFILPNEEHQFRNTGQDKLEFLCLIPIKK
ncbi:MAG: cupin domain-containing protein, partial [Candidatus Aminicenantes bacterium]|nr:cupin domain-containing protein [Candidatus Aminicenantes bacterium]